ncbi:hypothetical protein IL972_00035 [Acinetobacter sp. FL51]|uniref:hypothetical protein n=1 Tax=Acinetobacter sp. FL51 TaxID=2777978 RepID=UPI0018E1AEB6|nr:hypothetical protein [Acinetobacter sp. FL51]MBI1450326.1 hypothetical protein [Acinetobacter sp. FL51]
MATSSLGRLTLDMVVKLGNYMEGLDKAGRQAKKSGKDIESGLSVGSLAIKALGAAAAGITVGGIAAFASETIEAGNEIKKFSQLANTSIRDFQYYSKGAATAGINIESFADKMKDMQDRIGDFQQSGGGPLADFFENIAPLVGVTIQQFQKLSGPEALQLYYDSLVKVGASQNDVKFYMEAIISDSSLLLPLLENNGAGFKKWGDEAQRTGAILSDDMVNSLASAKEHLQMMDLQWQGLQANLINSVVPVLEVVTDNIDDIKAVGVAVAVGMSAKFIPVIIASTIQLGQLAVFSVRAGAGLLSLSSGAGVAASTMTVLRGALAFLGGPAGIGMLAIQGIAAGSAFLYMKKSSNEVDGALSKQGKSVAELITEYNNLSEAQQRAFKYQETVELKELGEKYNQTRQQVRAYASSIAEVVAKNEATKNTIRGWIKDFDNQRISAEDLANKINKLSDVGSENKQNMDKHAVAATNAKNSMIAQQKVVESLATQTVNLTKKSDALTVSTKNQAQAWLTLTQKQRAALTDIQDQNARSQYIANNMALGWSRDKAEYVADYRDKAGLGYSKRLTKYELIQLENSFKIQQQAKAREESEKKIEESNRKQLESHKEINKLVGASALSGLRIKSSESIAGGQVRAYTANFAQLAQDQLGERLKRFTAFNDTYHKGTNSKHATGNAFDFTIADTAKSAEAVAELEKLAKRYGYTIKVLDEYKQKSARATGGHLHVSVLGYKGTQDAISEAKAEVAIAKEIESEKARVKRESAELQKNVRQMYFTEDQRMAFDHEEKLKVIGLAYAGDDAAIMKYSVLENAAYKKSVDEYKESLTQKSLDEKKQLLEVRKNWLTAGDYAEQYYALVREEILNTSEYSPEMKDALIKQANSQQGIDQNADRENVWADYKSMMGLDESPYQQDIDLLAEARAQMLITEEEYQQQRLGMQLKYGTAYGSDFAGMLMGLVDQSSSAYAGLYAIQKGFNLASAIMSGYTAIAAAWASAAFPYNMPAVAMATMETGVLQAAISAITPVGMAHDGIDNIPKEGTWLLDGGERVLNPEQNKDLTNYLANRPSSSGVDAAPQLYQSIINVVNWDDVPSVMAGPAGQKTTLNTISRNVTQVKKLLGIQ